MQAEVQLILAHEMPMPALPDAGWDRVDSHGVYVGGDLARAGGAEGVRLGLRRAEQVDELR